MIQPSDFFVSRRGNDFRIIIRTPLPARIAAAGLWALGSLLFWIAVLRPKDFDILPFSLSAPAAFGLWSAASLWGLYLVIRKTTITAANGKLTVVHAPIPFPPAVRVNIEDICNIQVDTKVRSARDMHGRELAAYASSVQLSLFNDWHNPEIYSTSAPDKAAWLRWFLVQNLDFPRFAPAEPGTPATPREKPAWGPPSSPAEP